MTLPLTKLSLTKLDIRLSESEYGSTIPAYRRAASFINRLHNDISDFTSFESFQWTNYCHHVKKNKTKKTITGFNRQGEELWQVTYKGGK